MKMGVNYEEMVVSFLGVEQCFSRLNCNCQSSTISGNIKGKVGKLSVGQWPMADSVWVCSCLKLVSRFSMFSILLLSVLFTTFQVPKLLVTIVFLLCTSSSNLFNIKRNKVVIAVTVVVLMTRLKCKSDNEDERKKVTLAIIHVSFKTRPQNSKVSIYVLSMWICNYCSRPACGLWVQVRKGCATST